MGRSNPQSQGKRQREQLKQEKRRAKEEKRAARKAAKEAGVSHEVVADVPATQSE